MASKKNTKSIWDDPPRKNVFLLTCMDLRLLDDTVHFMNSLNLENRYDQLILAGSSMGARLLGTAIDSSGTELPWKAVFFQHLTAAIDVLHRDIKDIILLEHLDCGAYKYLHPDEDVRSDYKECEDLDELADFHRTELTEFAKEIRKFCRHKHKSEGNAAWKGIRVRCLIMDLLGDVEDICCEE